MIKTELLLPAGDLNRAKTAIDFGADAIYLGAKAYSLRARASNFTFDDIKEISEYVHARNKKWYIVVNIVCQNSMISGFNSFFKKILKFKPDAAIVSDPFIMSMIKKIKKDFPIHISTQQSVTNSQAALFFKKQNASRIILSREVDKKNLTLLMANVNKKIEIETFVHGAVCIGYSGRCMLSNNFCLRDSNIGGCAQCCRWQMTIFDEQKEYSNKFTISPKDMCLIEKIRDLMELNLSSFKIEGRMKSEYYIATIANDYRRVIDSIYNKKNDYKKYILDVEKCANRPADVAWYNGQPGYDKMLFYDVPSVVKQNFCFVIKKIIDEKILEIVVRNKMRISDQYELICKNGNEIISFKINKIINNDNKNVIVLPTPMEIATIYINHKLPCSIGDIGRIVVL